MPRVHNAVAGENDEGKSRMTCKTGLPVFPSCVCVMVE